jgi:hypothetical protein
MTDSAESFRARCTEAAEHFLQTVVVIDNEAEFDDSREPERPRIAQKARTGLLAATAEDSGIALGESVADPPDGISTPSQMAAVDQPTTAPGPLAKPVFSGGPGGPAVVAATEPIDSAVSHRLDAKTLTDAFGDHSVLCTVYKPRPGEQMVERAAKIASHADIVVVDWYLERGSSAIAKEIIYDILRTDAARKGRLRLIAIYTAESGMAGLAGDLREYLETRDLHFENAADGVLEASGVRIVFLQKAGGGMQRPARSVAEQELPLRLIEEFAELSAGILSMVALQSIAAIREGSHHILSTFHPGLDAAFVLHRCLLRYPADAEAFAVSLISAELASLLDADDVGKYAGIDVKKDWVAANQPRTEGFPIGAEFISVENLYAWLEQGTQAGPIPPQQANKKQHDVLAEALYGSAEKARECCLALARISCLKREAYSHRSIASNKPPMLCLGTILRPLPNERYEYPKRLGSETFLLCTQPACDSVRIKGERSYPFLRLAKTDGRFNVVVKLRDKTNATLLVSGEPHLTEMFAFKSASAQKDFVLAQAVEGCLVFTDVEGNQFEWLADLNDFTAQWAMAQLGARVNTPGLDQFEWLRLKGKAKK